jgi:hypothetical protein
MAIAAVFNNIPHPLNGIYAIHVTTLDNHNVIVPWLTLHDENCVSFHHITNSVGMEDHSLDHLLCTCTCVQAGNSPTISTDYAQQAAMDHMLPKWHIMS